MQTTRHPLDPPSNVAKFGGYDPEKYAIDKVTLTVRTHEDLTPGKPPYLTQNTIGKYLQPLTRELVEVPPRPLIHELPDAVIENMVAKDKAFWVDKPGANAYTLHDAYHNSGMAPVVVKPRNGGGGHTQELPSRRRRRSSSDAADELPSKRKVKTSKKVGAQCRDCKKLAIPGLTPFQLAWGKDPGQKRWKYYPDLSATMTYQDIKILMDEVGRPYKNEAINWYYKNYPPVKYNTIMRKFSQ